MAIATTVARPARLLPFERLASASPELFEQYRENRPFPHILIKDFLEPEIALEISREFPQPTGDAWTQYKHANENKVGMPKREMFPAMIGAVTDELNSPEFVRVWWLIPCWRAVACISRGQVGTSTYIQIFPDITFIRTGTGESI